MIGSAPGWKGSFLRYGIAVAAILVASFLRMAITYFVGNDFPMYITFFPAIMVVAIFCGPRAGIFASILTVLAVDYWFITPGSFFDYEDAGQTVGQVLFVATGVFVCVMAWQYRRTAEAYQQERVRRESEMEFRQMANTIPHLAWVAKPDGYVNWYNDRWYDYTGTTQKQIEGWGWQSVFHPEEVPAVVKEWSACLASGRVFDMTFSIRSRDGDYRQFLTRAVPQKDADGKIIQWFGTNTDVTEQRQMEEDLRRSEERFRMLFEQAAVGIKRLGLDGRLLEINDKFCDILGYKREELLAMSLKDFTHPDDMPLEQKMLEALLSGQIAEYVIEKRCLRKDGKVIWTRVTSSLPSNGQETKWWISVVEDITLRKQAQEDLRKTAGELARSNRDLEQFAYVSSHDLQEPLRMVTGFMQLLEEKYKGQLDETGKKYITFAVDGAKRMQQLIDDLLAYSRVGTRGKAPEHVDAQQKLDDALANLQVSIKESGARITHGRLPTVNVDGRQLTQVFQNLISNAIKFRGDGPPEVKVDACRDGEGWLFAVKDNGIGISPEFADRIFVIFQRLHSRDKYPGTGIGLAICKKIVERHGGRIWVDSEEGKGATFYFTLPG